MVMSAQEMEDNYGHYFDQIIVNTDLERTFDELIKAINELEGKAQWVPVRWVRPK
jgi:MAGUK p55 subfamily protein 5